MLTVRRENLYKDYDHIFINIDWDIINSIIIRIIITIIAVSFNIKMSKAIYSLYLYYQL